ncbi:hypothetical protein G7092_02510 [Mucilaginibacter sp. HC2]|uniref:hypothetical protein n=1 Tax=Mucilaginibacter inviolabilis TaxID=2714892 RepID=UPI0014089B0C|nr:hypothetical protein [Mucilaginibacter inviolabilis]NHA02648.1 hypothetical protein [Mucilaginibacter inviolabilis]
MKKEVVLAVRTITAIFWLGFFMAISFLETPLKFTAPGISMAQGLQIGRIVFRALNRCEWGFLIIILLTYFPKRSSRYGFYLLLAISIILILETAWLLPVLDAHAARVIKGLQPPGHLEHWVYIILEVIKIPVLLLIGLESGRTLYDPASVHFNPQDHERT